LAPSGEDDSNKQQLCGQLERVAPSGGGGPARRYLKIHKPLEHVALGNEKLSPSGLQPKLSWQAPDDNVGDKGLFQWIGARCTRLWMIAQV